MNEERNDKLKEDKPINWIKVLIYSIFYIAVVVTLTHIITKGFS